MGACTVAVPPVSRCVCTWQNWHIQWQLQPDPGIPLIDNVESARKRQNGIARRSSSPGGFPLTSMLPMLTWNTVRNKPLSSHVVLCTSRNPPCRCFCESQRDRVPHAACTPLISPCLLSGHVAVTQTASGNECQASSCPASDPQNQPYRDSGGIDPNDKAYNETACGLCAQFQRERRSPPHWHYANGRRGSWAAGLTACPKETPCSGARSWLVTSAYAKGGEQTRSKLFVQSGRV